MNCIMYDVVTESKSLLFCDDLHENVALFHEFLEQNGTRDESNRQ